ncbi:MULTISPECIES: hypothetical protein [Enterococcus]|nr:MULTISPECIES: hypothetical protein [Enterococcus]MBM7690436.1 ABC-type polar amino acid transport system ATPase subunit [Enterococcus ureilyticus]
MQCVAIARALAIDPQLAQEVLRLLQSQTKSGNSQIIVTHNIEVA